MLPVANFFEGAFFGGGTLPPACRASDSPIAIACLRLVTFLPDLPLFKVPALSSRITLVTFSDAFLPYLLAIATLVVRGSSFTLESRTSKALSVSPILRAAARAW